MKSSAPIALVLTLVLFGSVALSCGNSATSSSSSAGDPLLSISVTPAVADAGDYANGQVQFSAVGYYSTNPAKAVVLTKPGWGSCYQNQPAPQVTVTSTGVAQCAAGATGTFTVWADAPPVPDGPNCLAVNACGGGCFVAGTAQLTCP